MYQTTLLEYLMVSFAVILSLRMYYTAHPPADGARSAAAPAPGLSGRKQTPPASPAEIAQLAETLRRFADGGDEIEALLEGAKLAYEAVVLAFAYGDFGEHRHLLTEPVREAFEDAIAERRARGERQSVTIVGFSAAEIVAAGLDGARAWMQIRFAADLVSVTHDSDGKVTAGHPSRMTQTDELWTFERDLSVPGPDWLLAATEPRGG